VSRKLQLGIASCRQLDQRLQLLLSHLPFVTGSQYVLKLLHRLGLSVSYDEVVRFKQCVTQCDSVDPQQSYPECFTQYVTDNIDHDVCTLDGNGTLHAMGIISIGNFGPETTSHVPSETPVARLKRTRSAAIAKVNRIPVYQCHLPDEFMNGVTFKSLVQLSPPQTLSPSLNLDILFHYGWFLQNEAESRPSWTGFNDFVFRQEGVCVSDICMQLIIDLNPTDSSCIYSMLVFISEQSKKLNNRTPTITFDQRLWLKAVNVGTSHKLNVVCRLGSFHI